MHLCNCIMAISKFIHTHWMNEYITPKCYFLHTQKDGLCFNRMMEIRLSILFIPELETLWTTSLIFLLFSGLDGFREIHRWYTVAKIWGPSTGAGLNLADRVWGELQRNGSIALPGKGDHCRPSRLCVTPWRGSEPSYNVQGAGHDQLLDILLIDW